jgi:hypothetical protein
MQGCQKIFDQILFTIPFQSFVTSPDSAHQKAGSDCTDSTVHIHIPAEILLHRN